VAALEGQLRAIVREVEPEVGDMTRVPAVGGGRFYAIVAAIRATEEAAHAIQRVASHLATADRL
jgi:hypothetical protein